jgi:hypothetical protein
LALGGIIAALPGPGKPGVHVSWADVLLWLAVMGAVGSVNALLVYLLAGRVPPSAADSTRGRFEAYAKGADKMETFPDRRDSR